VRTWRARRAVAQERVTRGPDGLVRITLKKPFSDGTVAVDLDPLSLLSRLAASVPAPRLSPFGDHEARQTVRYAGVLASASKLRPRLAPKPAVAPKPTAEVPESPRRGGYRPWAELLKRTFRFDVLTCPCCSGRMKLLALVTDPSVFPDRAGRTDARTNAVSRKSSPTWALAPCCEPPGRSSLLSTTSIRGANSQRRLGKQVRLFAAERLDNVEDLCERRRRIGRDRDGPRVSKLGRRVLEPARAGAERAEIESSIATRDRQSRPRVGATWSNIPTPCLQRHSVADDDREQAEVGSSTLATAWHPPERAGLPYGCEESMPMRGSEKTDVPPWQPTLARREEHLNKEAKRCCLLDVDDDLACRPTLTKRFRKGHHEEIQWSASLCFSCDSVGPIGRQPDEDIPIAPHDRIRADSEVGRDNLGRGRGHVSGARG
jgi:hypothetical protein